VLYWKGLCGVREGVGFRGKKGGEGGGGG